MKKVIPVLTGVYNSPSLRKRCIPLFIGNSGLGKTQLIEGFAREKGVSLVKVVASQKMPHEISGISMPLNEEKRMTYFDYDLFMNLKDGDIIFFDELLNASPMILNACLTILEDRTLISGKKLPDVMIVAASNWQGATVVTPQIKERFIWYNVSYSYEMYFNYLERKYNITQDIFLPINKLIISESFKTEEYNYMTPRSIDKAIEMMIYNVDTPYSDKLKPILNGPIKNILPTPIDINGYRLEPNEMISWLKLKQLENGTYSE